MRNEEKYTTPEERIQAFNEKCVRNIGNCINFPLGFRDCKETIECFAHWLALEAEEEKPEPCPFCGGDVSEHVAGEHRRMTKLMCSCGYSSEWYETKDATIAAHNRVCRAVENYKK